MPVSDARNGLIASKTVDSYYDSAIKMNHEGTKITNKQEEVIKMELSVLIQPCDCDFVSPDGWSPREDPAVENKTAERDRRVSRSPLPLPKKATT